MKLTGYTVIKKDILQSLQDENLTLKQEIAQANDFIHEIEKGNLDVHFEADETALDTLSGSLSSMRARMKTIAEEDRQRQWVAEGLAHFADILRTKNDAKNLADLTLSNLVKYMDVTQGALYVLNEDNAADVHIEMIACYAYGRKKHQEQRLNLGEGLVGQAVLEQEVIYMTSIPADYMKITSGLGEALPRTLLITPMKLNEKVFGIIELASFTPIPAYRIDFVKKLGESIASQIAAEQNRVRMEKLLTETQVQAEAMRSQEEEMRQNMEELTSTQEEMQRIIQEVQRNEEYLSELLNASPDTIITVDRDLRITHYNKAFAEYLSQTAGNVLPKGFYILDLYRHDPERQQSLRKIFQRVFEGELVEDTHYMMRQDQKHHRASIYAPLGAESGKIYGAAAYTRDITEAVNARETMEALLADANSKAEQMKAQEDFMVEQMQELMDAKQKAEMLLEQSQQQTEEMKAQEEILMQNMEEMKAQEEVLLQNMEQMKAQEEILVQNMAQFKAQEEILQQNMAQFQAQEEMLQQNIQALKVTEEALARREAEMNHLMERFQLLESTTTEGHWDILVPAEGLLLPATSVWWSPGIRQVLRLAAEDVFEPVLESLSQLLHPGHADRVLRALHDHLRDTSGLTAFDVQCPLKVQGAYRWFRMVGKTLRNANGHARRTAGILVDVEQQQAADRLSDTVQQQIL